MLKRNLFIPEYESTDKVNSYGTLFYKWFSVFKATAITAEVTWVFERKGLFSPAHLITVESGVKIGELTSEWFSRNHSLTMQNGFIAKFFKLSIRSNQYVWISDDDGNIFYLKKIPFSFKDSVYIN